MADAARTTHSEATRPGSSRMRELLALVAAGAAFAGGSTETDGLSGSIKIAGSSTVYPITVAVAEEFSKIHPDVEIAVQSTGTGGGFGNFFIPGATQINDASRPIKDSEREAAIENGITPVELVVATDAITVVINPEKFVARLDLADAGGPLQRTPDSPAAVILIHCERRHKCFA